MSWANATSASLWAGAPDGNVDPREELADVVVEPARLPELLHAVKVNSTASAAATTMHNRCLFTVIVPSKRGSRGGFHPLPHIPNTGIP